jgi:hypothetical protein
MMIMIAEPNDYELKSMSWLFDIKPINQKFINDKCIILAGAHV